MTRFEIRSFEPGDVPAAGELLARRHAAHRAIEPLLAEQFTDPVVAAAQVEALLDDGATGTVSCTDGRVSGYLLGIRKSDSTWGPNVWVEAAGHAVDDPETARDLYAAAAARWHDEGRPAHYVLLPASDAALVDAWFRLGFGMQHIHGIREVPPTVTAPSSPVVVRRAVRADIPALAALDLALPQHQGLSPVFSSGHLPTLDEAVAEWEEGFDDEGFANFVAELDGAVVGAATGCALEKSSTYQPLTRPDHAGFLGFAAVLPDARGHGVGRALGEAVLAWTTQAGFTSAVTDWRVTNLLSSRTWPRLGFRPAFLRLHRLIGH